MDVSNLMSLVSGSYRQAESAIDRSGQKLRDVGFPVKGNLVEFEIRENEFAYVLRKDEQ